jgi:CRISPR-associated protein Csm3
MAANKIETMIKTLIKKIFISGEIKALTGLHIGGSNTAIEIGGVDTSVIRNPFNDEPYIPGSSLKGKIRSLLEQTAGSFGRGAGQVKNGPIDDINHKIAKVFGTAKGNDSNIPSKIIVRDAELIDEDNFLKNNNKTDLPFTEVKTEIMVDRITAVASPRQIERVPAGAKFKLDIVVNIWNNDISEADAIELIFNGMRLLQDDYLGGKGSRGSGQVKLGIKSIEERSNDFYLGNENYDGKLRGNSQHEIPQDLQYEG